MKAISVIMVLIIAAGSVSGCLSDSERQMSDEEEDLTPLRINHIQMKGTHNSYHLAPIGPTIRAYDLTLIHISAPTSPY